MPNPKISTSSQQPDPQTTGQQTSALRRSGAPAPDTATVPGRLGRREVWVLAAVAVATAAGLGATAVFTGGEITGASDTATSANEFEHVHGVGVDPADGAVYAGTHHGLFRLSETGEATRVGGRVQDFMGFTVVGPNHFLGSGHPGDGEDGPSSLGLIESTDAGRSWEPVSLAGEADFHSLEAHGEVTYGFNALTGEFLASPDREVWQQRSTLPMADFTANPADPTVVVATTESGPAMSEDGGRTFTGLRNAPLLLLVDWAEDGTLAGVGPDGAVYLTDFDSDVDQAETAPTWREAAEIGGAPEAFEVIDRDTMYAVTDGEVLVSTDGGTSFTRYGA